MLFEAESVHRLLGMIEADPPVPAEAGRLAALTGSWPELLAHLLLRRGSFASEPEIEAALRAPAERFRSGPLNRRPADGSARQDVVGQERSQQALEAALAELLAAERQRAGTMAAAEAALREHVLARPRRGFDLHRRIRPDAG